MGAVLGVRGWCCTILVPEEQWRAVWGVRGVYLNVRGCQGMICSLRMLHQIFRFHEGAPRQAKEEAKRTIDSARCKELLDQTRENLDRYVQFLPKGPVAKEDIPRDTLLGLITGRIRTGAQYDPMALSLDDGGAKEGTAKYPYYLLGDSVNFLGTPHQQISMLVTPHTCNPKLGNVMPYLEHVEGGGLPLSIVYNMERIPKGTPLRTHWGDFTFSKQKAQRIAPSGSTIRPCRCAARCPNFYLVPRSGTDFMDSYALAYQRVFGESQEEMEACGGQAVDVREEGESGREGDAEVQPPEPASLIKKSLRQHPQKKMEIMTTKQIIEEICRLMGGYITEVVGFTDDELHNLLQDIRQDNELKKLIEYFKTDPVKMSIKYFGEGKGNGVIADQFIKKGTLFLPYWGALCKRSGEDPTQYEKDHKDYEFNYSMNLEEVTVVKDCFISAAATIDNGQIQMANANHCCYPFKKQFNQGVSMPPCEVKFHSILVFLVASEDIHPGQEITYSYGDYYWRPLQYLKRRKLKEGEYIHECLCHDGNCPQKVGKVRSRSGLRVQMPIVVAQPLPEGVEVPNAYKVFLSIPHTINDLPSLNVDKIMNEMEYSLHMVLEACDEIDKANESAQKIAQDLESSERKAEFLQVLQELDLAAESLSKRRRLP